MSDLNILAFDTSTEALSVGLLHRGQVVEQQSAGGAQASSTLIPTIQALLRDAGIAMRELDAIAFGRGPGSFTGLRTACSVAQGLGFGAGVPLLPIDTLHAVAEHARHAFGAQRVVTVLDARMDQVYSAAYDFTAPADAVEPQLLAPEEVSLPEGWVLAGNAFDAYGERLPSAAARHFALPTAGAMLRLAPALLAAGRVVAPSDAWPLYVRDKVAQTTAERAAAKQPTT